MHAKGSRDESDKTVSLVFVPPEDAAPSLCRADER